MKYVKVQYALNYNIRNINIKHFIYITNPFKQITKLLVNNDKTKKT